MGATLMPGMPSMPNIPSGGKLQQRAAQLRTELEAKKKAAQPPSSTEPAQPPAEQETSPVGQGEHVVRPGECVSSIAKATGHFWEKLWNDPANAEVKQVRQDPHVLLPGDRVTVPPIEPKREPGQTELRHRFKRRGEPGILRMVIKDMDEPRANQPYVLKIGERELRGFTDPNGRLEQPIPSGAKQATLIVGEGDDQEEYDLNLGSLDPIDSISGVQARLDNLGYDVGPADGVIGNKTIAAIEKFCGDHDIEPPPRGQIGTLVRSKLREVHGF